MARTAISLMPETVARLNEAGLAVIDRLPPADYRGYGVFEWGRLHYLGVNPDALVEGEKEFPSSYLQDFLGFSFSRFERAKQRVKRGLFSVALDTTPVPPHSVQRHGSWHIDRPIVSGSSLALSYIARAKGPTMQGALGTIPVDSKTYEAFQGKDDKPAGAQRVVEFENGWVYEAARGFVHRSTENLSDETVPAVFMRANYFTISNIGKVLENELFEITPQVQELLLMA